MPKKKPEKRDDAKAVERFERALRNALATPPDSPRKKKHARKSKRVRK